MIEFCIIWRRDDPKQPGMETILTGAKYYKQKYGRAPNFINLSHGFLDEVEIEKLRKCFTVATNAPVYFKDDVWLGVMTPATMTGLDTAGAYSTSGKTEGRTQ